MPAVIMDTPRVGGTDLSRLALWESRTVVRSQPTRIRAIPVKFTDS
jgi:hypothetical protein